MAMTTAAVGVAGAGISALGSIFGGNQQAENIRIQAQNDAMAADEQARALEFNAMMTRRTARQTLDVGASKARQLHSDAISFAGNQRAAIAQSGGGFGASASMLVDQSAANAELDRQNALYDAALKEQSLSAQAGEYERAASTARTTASAIRGNIGSAMRNARIGGYLGAGGALLQGAGNFAYMTGLGRRL